MRPACIEQVCDRAEDEIAQLAAREKRGINSRSSPGYGDLPLSVQPKLLAVLDAERRLGLTVTGSDLLIPAKIGYRFDRLHHLDTKKERQPLRHLFHARAVPL